MQVRYDYIVAWKILLLTCSQYFRSPPAFSCLILPYPTLSSLILRRSIETPDRRIQKAACLLYVDRLQLIWVQKTVALGRRCERGHTVALNVVDERFAAYSHLTIHRSVPNASLEAQDASIRKMPTVTSLSTRGRTFANGLQNWKCFSTT